MQVINSLIFMVISKCLIFYTIHVRKRMNRHMNRLYLGLFLNYPLMGFFRAFFSLLRTYWGCKISWACICCKCLTFFHKMTIKELWLWLPEVHEPRHGGERDCCPRFSSTGAPLPAAEAPPPGRCPLDSGRRQLRIYRTRPKAVCTSPLQYIHCKH